MKPIALLLSLMLSLTACPPRDPHPERTPSPAPSCNLGAGACPLQSGRQDAA